MGWISLGDTRVFLSEALGGFYSLREQIAQEIGPEAEADMVQRAGFSSAERLVTAGRQSGELSDDEVGFTRALALLTGGGYGNFSATELRFADRWARVTVEDSLEGWMFRETGTRPTNTCDFTRGLLAGIMHFLARESVNAAFGSAEEVEAANGPEINCIELNCISGGDDCCEFVLGPASLLLAEGLQPAPVVNSSVRETLLRLNRQLEQILDSSRKDPLTKLYNRSFFESALRQRIGYAKRRSDVVSLAIIDIDYFKTVNDTHGHTVGDRVLRQLARTLELQARENDVVARLGGDEFVWLMPATPGDAALAVAQRLRRTMDDLQASVGFGVTASIGVANYPEDASSPAELFERADTALFTAKRAGRDRVARYSATVPSPTPNGTAINAQSLPPQIQAALPDTHFAPAPTPPRQDEIGSHKRSRAVKKRNPELTTEPSHRFGAQNTRSGFTDAATEEAFPQPGRLNRYKKARY